MISLFFSTCLPSPAVCPTMEDKVEMWVHGAGFHLRRTEGRPHSSHNYGTGKDTTLPAPLLPRADVEAVAVSGENWRRAGVIQE